MDNWQVSVATATEKNIGLTMVLLLAGLGFHPAAQDVHEPLIVVSGKVICLKPERGVLSEVVVFNQQRNRGVLTGNDACFHIKMNRGDTLVFSTSSHKDFYYFIPDDLPLKDHTIEIILEPDTVWQEIAGQVGPDDLDTFRKEIIDMDLPDDQPNLIMPVAEKHAHHLATGEGALTLTGPLSYLGLKISRYMRLKKQIKESSHEE